MELAAYIFFAVVVGAGVVLFIVNPTLPPVDTDDKGRPTDDYPTAQAFHDVKTQGAVVGRELLKPVEAVVRWLNKVASR